MVEFMSTKAGNPAKDQKVITTDKGRYLQSYDSVVAFIPDDDGPIQVGPDYDYSSTTIYYVGKFLRMNLPKIREGLKKGTILLEDSLAAG
ncbi:hypothetical protein FACS1894109_10910 [Spirochaetia bacterium]|nr:hypothetical protein FACS1894109_10910 [Spirochaetia bacterium]